MINKIMAIRYFLYALIIVCGIILGCSRDQTGEAKIAKNTNALLKTMDSILIKHKASYHLFLWEATHTLEKYYLKENWEAVKFSLEKNKFQSIKSNEKAPFFNYLIQKGMTFANSKYTYNLYVEFITNDGFPHEMVAQVKVGLRAPVNLPYISVVTDEEQPDDSVVHQILETKESKIMASFLPNVKEISVSYGLITYFEAPYSSPYGFHVTVSFGSGGNQRTLYYTAESGLDPIIWDYDYGKLSVIYEPKDTLNAITCWSLPVSVTDSKTPNELRRDRDSEPPKDKPADGK